MEGRERVGGRVLTDRETFSRPIDLGASIITGIAADVNKGRRFDPSSTIFQQLGLKTKELEGECPIFDAVKRAKISKEMDRKIAGVFDGILDMCTNKALAFKAASGGKGVGKENFGDTVKELFESERALQEGDGEKVEDKQGAADEGGEEVVTSLRQLTEEDLRVLRWHYAHTEYGCSARLNEISLEHWNQDESEDGAGFGGPHVMVPGGYSRAMESLSDGLHVRTKACVKGIKYGDGKVEVTCSNPDDEGDECIVADSVVVTVPLGCLKRKKIEFDPPLPDWKQECIDRLGYGNLNKVVLEFKEEDDGNVFWEQGSNSVGDVMMFGMTSESESTCGRFFMFWNMKKVCGSPILIGLLAGEAAYEAEQEDNKLVPQAMGVLRNLFHDVTVPEPVSCRVTSWLSDEFSHGSYSFVAAGASGDDYDTLALPVSSLVHFAGEHTWRKNPDTVGGAMLSGIREAQSILRMFSRDVATVVDDMMFTLDASKDLEEGEEEEGDGWEEEEEDIPKVENPKFKGEKKAKKQKPRQQKIVGTVPYLSNADHAQAKEEIRNVYTYFEMRKGSEDFAELMGSLKSLDGKRAFVKQCIARGDKTNYLGALKEKHLGLLNSWILEFADAPLCTDFICDCIRLLNKLNLEIKDMKETKLGKTMRNLAQHQPVKVKKLVTYLLKQVSAVPAKADKEKERSASGDASETKEAKAPKIDEEEVKKLEQMREEIKRRKEEARRRHEEASKKFQEAARMIGVMDAAEPPSPRREKRKHRHSSSEKSKKARGDESGGEKRVDKKLAGEHRKQCVSYIKNLLKESLKEGKIDKEQFKAIVAKVWGKLEHHPSLGKDEEFLTNDRKGKIVKLIKQYVAKS
uniref:Amine oxidase domain-containing protein n=1 Tax=Chloropicon primus TaxID=1764295 RepID=A0A7S2X317_9CHLO